ncbi:MAG: zinc-ribbon domain containing protein [Methylocystaceae bacterium]
MFEDKVLVCQDCGNEFIFTAGEQEFYAEKGFVNEPKRCKECRDSRKGRGNGEGRARKQMFTATCASCGVETEVPFKPTADRPVYCWECYNKNKEAAGSY